MTDATNPTDKLVVNNDYGTTIIIKPGFDSKDHATVTSTGPNHENLSYSSDIPAAPSLHPRDLLARLRSETPNAAQGAKPQYNPKPEIPLLDIDIEILVFLNNQIALKTNKDITQAGVGEYERVKDRVPKLVAHGLVERPLSANGKPGRSGVRITDAGRERARLRE
jgi:hypothetical protein